ncbi:MAG: nuclear transport factor 2 family protein [Acidimicrobiales bacterium]|jgi:3-phenylpropionate/cinnamic acid dioxygenase small subunit|nr:nuclear transport factor 2 family protein [Acidimicrobiales bacterium]
MDDARRIENLLYTYAERIDGGDLAGVAELFTHGRIHGMEDPSPEAVFEGRDGVAKLYDLSTRIYEDDGTPKTHHITTNIRLEIADDGQTASSRAYYCVMQATDVLPLQPIITGRYHDTFHKIAGEWWFDTRVMFVDQMGDLSQHLLYELR